VLRALIMIAATGETVHTSLNMGTLTTLFAYFIFISVKNSKYKL